MISPPVRAREGREMTLKQANTLQDVESDLPRFVGLFRRCFEGKASPSEAIRCKCVECVYGDRKAIAECTATECPLWAYRPYQNRGLENEKAE